jgi:hypothetical protein
MKPAGTFSLYQPGIVALALFHTGRPNIFKRRLPTNLSPYRQSGRPQVAVSPVPSAPRPWHEVECVGVRREGLVLQVRRTSLVKDLTEGALGVDHGWYIASYLTAGMPQIIASTAAFAEDFLKRRAKRGTLVRVPPMRSRR